MFGNKQSENANMMLGLSYGTTKENAEYCQNRSSKSTEGSHLQEVDYNAAKYPPQHRLAYLDGLRGIAALIVYMQHYQGLTLTQDEKDIVENAFGFKNIYSIAALPVVRLFYNGGHFSVAIFFVMSGYVLSYGLLKTLHTRNMPKLVEKLSSAIFRRWPRLWLPVLAITVLYILSWHWLGVSSYWTWKPTLLEELWNVYGVLKKASFVYSDLALNIYVYTTWTIPLEFRGSMVVYTAVLTFSRLGTGQRLCCELGLIWYFTYIVDGWFCALFMIGMLLCDIDLLAERDELPELFDYLKPLKSWIYPVLLLVGLYLGGVPCREPGDEQLRDQPGWYWLSFLKPAAMWDLRWFFRGTGATLTMIAVRRVSILKSFFENRFCQYMGRISFGFYLVHAPLLFTLGDRLLAASGRVAARHPGLAPHWINVLPMSERGPLGLEINSLAAQLILLPTTLWAADLFTRLVDEPSVKFCHWLLNQIMKKRGQDKKSGVDHLV